MADRYTFNEVCQTLGKSRLDVRNLQKLLGLHVPPAESGYDTAYVNFMQKVVSLRSFSIPLEDIRELFDKEKKILSMLHVDTLTASPTWYLDSCAKAGHSPSRLLLSGYDFGFPIASGIIQANLNFRSDQAELFSGTEMGEDINRVVSPYLKLVARVRERVLSEERVLENALLWSERAFWAAGG